MILSLNEQFVKIRHNFNTLNFRFSFPLLSELPVTYRYELEGLDNDWSAAMSAADFRFERLPRGHYNLKVKAVDLWGNESKTFSYAFEILPPLAASRWAIFFYTLIAVTALFMFRRWGIRQTRKKEQRQHEKRERELIRLRNEKLRDEVRFKSKDLANSTMAIIRKNEFLIDLKKIIKKHKDELGSRYPDKYFNYLNRKIDENISSRDDRQIFENNFERTHEQFFQKMKNSYPELTSSDLQLCAYLRMNLSSKEIAPLLGISIRGVENHRYRLRKKLHLEHDENLTDTIMAI
jgi:DNA-binding CsgD family transcriptional regulator